MLQTDLKRVNTLIDQVFVSVTMESVKSEVVEAIGE